MKVKDVEVTEILGVDLLVFLELDQIALDLGLGVVRSIYQANVGTLHRPRSLVYRERIPSASRVLETQVASYFCCRRFFVAK